MNRKFAIGLMALAALALGACTRVDPGHVGVKVNRYGSSAGVEAKALGIGTYQTMFGVDIYEYPIYTSNYAWTAKGENGNEEFAFQDSNGLVVEADVSVAYRVDPAKAPTLFQKYRTDMDGIVAGPLRNAVRDALVECASVMSVEGIYGPKKTVLIRCAKDKTTRYFEQFGLHVEQLYWAGPIRIPENILERINARAQNEQAAIAARANLQTVEANAASAIAKAHGQAEAMRLQGEALRANPEIIDQQWIAKWKGDVPSTVYCSSSTPCLNMR
jgi:regulator of protease activity HflC (stomatin/prohibitin superfamily)